MDSLQLKVLEGLPPELTVIGDDAQELLDRVGAAAAHAKAELEAVAHTNAQHFVVVTLGRLIEMIENQKDLAVGVERTLIKLCKFLVEMAAASEDEGDRGQILTNLTVALKDLTQVRSAIREGDEQIAFVQAWIVFSQDTGHVVAHGKPKEEPDRQAGHIIRTGSSG